MYTCVCLPSVDDINVTWYTIVGNITV